jgi:hypothetical protein
MRIIFSLILPLLASNALASPFISGNVLHEAFQKSPSTQDSAAAEMFVIGVHDALEGVQASNRSNDYCIFEKPKNVTGQQVADVVKLFLAQHPEKRQYSAASLVVEALGGAWPCKR